MGEHLGCGIFRLNRLNYDSQENQWSCNFSYYWKVLIVMLLLISCTTKHMTQKRFHCNDASHLLDYCNIYKLINYTRHFQDLTYYEKIFMVVILYHLWYHGDIEYISHKYQNSHNVTKRYLRGFQLACWQLLDFE